MRWRPSLALALLVAAALPAHASAQGAVAFTSMRCDQGGVAFSGSHSGPFCTPGIFVVGDDGTGLKRLTTGGTPGEEHRSGDARPSWSPDGQRIAFSRQTNESHGLNRLFTMKANGSDVRRLLAESPFEDERDPSWSPKGDLIAFGGRAPGTFRAPLYVVAPDGSGLRKISPDGWEAQSPTFTPEGDGIAFMGGRYTGTGPGVTTDQAVWMTDANGSAPVRLTAGDIPIVTNGMSFSPGAKYVAVTLSNGSLYTLRTDGGELTRLTKSVSLDPDWAAAGATIFYERASDAISKTIMRLGFPRVAPPSPISAPGVGDAAPDWSLPGRAASTAPVVDELPPVAVLGETLDDPPADLSEDGGEGAPGGSSPKLAPAQFVGPSISKIPFLVMDRSGIRSVEAAAGLRVKGGCRFLQPSRKLGKRRACSGPTYVKVKNGEGWRKQVAKLPDGRYEVRFRTADREGNAVRKPRPRVVRVGR